MMIDPNDVILTNLRWEYWHYQWRQKQGFKHKSLFSNRIEALVLQPLIQGMKKGFKNEPTFLFEVDIISSWLITICFGA